MQFLKIYPCVIEFVFLGEMGLAHSTVTVKENLNLMNLSNLFKIGAIIFATGLVIWGVYTFFGAIGVAICILVTIAWICIELIQRSFVSVNEMEVGVVFNRKGNFVCFLDNEYGRIDPKKRLRKQNKLVTRHQINPFTEQMTGIITKGSQKAEGTLVNSRTVEGVPIKLKWSVSFKIIVTDIKSGLEFKMARSLPQFAPNVIGGKAEPALKHILETKHIHDLYTYDDEHSTMGPLQQLEIELRDEVRNLTAIFGANIGDRDVKLGPIEFPEGFEEALKHRFQKELQTETLVTALDRLREAIHKYDESDIKRLTELERIRILDEKSDAMMMVSESFVNTNKSKEVNKYKRNGNGRSKDSHNYDD